MKNSHQDAPSDYAAALFARGHRFRDAGVLAIEGPDREAFLQGQLTQDTRGLSAGQSRPMAGLTPKGKLLYFGRLVAQAERLLLLVPSSARAAVAEHLRKYAVFQKVSVTDRSEELLLLGLYGPDAALDAAARRNRASRRRRIFRVPPRSGRRPRRARVRPRGRRFHRRFGGLGRDPPRRSRAAPLRRRDRSGQSSRRARTPGRDLDEQGLLRRPGDRGAASHLRPRQPQAGRLPLSGGFRSLPEPSSPTPRRKASSSAASPARWSRRAFGRIGLGLAFRDVARGAALRLAAEPARCAVVVPLPFA